MIGFHAYTSFFGTMPGKYWDLLVSLNSLSPLRAFFVRFQPTNWGEECKSVISWLISACLDGLITSEEYYFLCGMIGTR